METTFDAYLARGLEYVLLVLIAGAIGAIGAVSQVMPWLAFGLAGGAVLLAVLIGSGWWVTPSVYRRKRAAKIDAVFPHALIMMYVLARAGMSLSEIIELLAEADDVYGELGVEFAHIHRDVTYFGADLQTALKDAQARTSSSDLETFLSDLGGLLESGSTLESFVEREHRRQLARASEEQETFLARLESFVQLYIIIVFVGPIFALILLILISFHGADTTGLIYFLAYLYPVGAIAIALAVLTRIETAVRLPAVRPRLSTGELDDAETRPTSRLYRRYRRRKRLRRLLKWNPLQTVYRHPWVILVLSLPATLGGAWLGLRPFGGVAAVWNDPIRLTAGVSLVLVVALLPVMVVLERKRAKRDAVIEQLGPICERFSEATAAGMGSVESCRLVIDRTADPARELVKQVHHEATLTGDPAKAFRTAAARVDIPDVTLTFAPIAAGYNATAKLETIFDELGKTARQRTTLTARRKRAMELYTLVVVMGLVVFIAVTFFLETFFLPNLEQAGEADGESPFATPPLDPEGYRLVLFHATLIQAAGNGLFIGKLRAGSLVAGLKYSLLFVVLTSLVFIGMTLR